MVNILTQFMVPNEIYTRDFFGNMVISALWSISIWSRRGPYIRDPVYIYSIHFRSHLLGEQFKVGFVMDSFLQGHIEVEEPNIRSKKLLCIGIFVSL